MDINEKRELGKQLIIYLVIIMFGCLLLGYAIGNAAPLPHEDKGFAGDINISDLSLIMTNQAIVASYVQQEAQCMNQIQKCKVLTDNNISFTMGCLKWPKLKILQLWQDLKSKQ